MEDTVADPVLVSLHCLPMHISFPRVPLRIWGAPALIALLGLIAVVCAIDPAGDYRNAPQGPGLTIDEPFNVQEGVRLVAALDAWVLGEVSLREVFGDRKDLGPNAPAGIHLTDHPPLGRLWIGLFHTLTASVVPLEQHPNGFQISVACARPASGAAFALLVFLVGCVTAKWYGPSSGLVAAASVVMMPRVFGHAHLASLETCTGLTYTAAVLCVASFWKPPTSPSMKAALLTGAVFGLALLTKIQAILIPIPIALWAFCHWRQRAIVPLVLWSAVGFLVFFVFWPWLWWDPIDHFKEYFGRTTDRTHLNTWYFGQQFADRDVPWHYPAVMFLTTVPVGLHLLGFVGLASGKSHAFKEPREQLVLGCLLFPLMLFSLPRITVYDGTRLFLVVFPLWAIFVGRGSLQMRDWLQRRFSRPVSRWLFILFFALQGYGVIALSPCSLSYYNLLVGGTRGAKHLGFETTYWGDSLTRDFLQTVVRQVSQGATIDVTPVLYQFQLDEMLRQSPILRGRGIQLRPFEDKNIEQIRYVMFFHRRADLSELLQSSPPQARLLAEVRRQGVQLAAAYELAPQQNNQSLQRRQGDEQMRE